jgi:hypothetical protein
MVIEVAIEKPPCTQPAYSAGPSAQRRDRKSRKSNVSRRHFPNPGTATQACPARLAAVADELLLIGKSSGGGNSGCCRSASVIRLERRDEEVELALH